MSRPRIYELVTVEYRSDPKFPGFTAIEITGPTAADVQLQMDRIYRSVERDGGQANFMGPSRRAGGYGALGGVSE
jgi:hypothetical protein